MAWEGEQILIPGLYSTTDLSALQFCPVKLSAANIVADLSTTSSGMDVPVGILQNAPTAGQLAEVCFVGICKAKGCTTIAYGDFIGCDTADSNYCGKITANVSTNKNAIFGRALSDASSDGIFTAMVNFCNLNFGSS
jgi:hypothetical protein